MGHRKMVLAFAFLTGMVFTDLQAQIVKDIEDNVYHTVTIGSQTWMKENLKVTKYRNGDPIGTTTPATLNISAEKEPKYQWSYNGMDSNIATYGRLYTWYAITDNRNVCPSGWHVPKYNDWFTLIKYLGLRPVAIGKLREPGSGYWKLSDSTANNETSFTAIPAGQRNHNGEFGYIGYMCDWWSSSEDIGPNSSSIFHLIIGSLGMPLKEYNEEAIGLPVRCLKD